MREKFKALKARFNSESGFTLIELMATLAILALIVVIAVPAIGNIINSAADNSGETTVDMIERSAEIAYVETLGTDGTGQESFGVQELIDDGYLDLELDGGTYKSGGYTIAGSDTVVKDPAVANGASFELNMATPPVVTP